MSKKTLKIPGRGEEGTGKARLPGGEGTWELPGMRIDLMVLLFFAAAVWIVYYPVVHNAFLSDDYDSLYRICIERRIIYKEVLRPLIDISFYLNYFISGLHPGSYYIFNLGIHVLACYMVYKVALRLPVFSGRGQFVFACAAGMVFLVYPFHNEPIVWLTGRLSSMAALCALLSIHFSLKKSNLVNFLLSACFFIAGTFAYESIVMLPAIIIVLNWPAYVSEGRLGRAIAAWAGVLLCCVALRYFIAGTLLPGYGSRIFSGGDQSGYAGRLLKTAGRCLLPPMEASSRMTGFFLVAIVAIAYVHFLLWKKRRAWQEFISVYTRLGVSFCLSMVPPVAFGISTRTSEGDRLLYFPSCFLCIMAAALIFRFIENTGRRAALLVALLACNVFLVERNNQRWVRASGAAEMILDTVRGSTAAHVFLLNVPDELEGAFVFRHGLQNALVLNNIDTGRVIVNNYLVRLQYLPAPGNIRPIKEEQGLFIYPDTRVSYPVGQSVGRQGAYHILNLATGQSRVFDPREDALYYWDKSQLKRVNLE